MSGQETTQSTVTDNPKSGRDKELDLAVLIAVPILSVLIIACIVILIVVCIQRKRWKNRQSQRGREEHWPQHHHDNQQHQPTTASTVNIRLEENSSSPDSVAPPPGGTASPTSKQSVPPPGGANKAMAAEDKDSTASNDDNTQVKMPVTRNNRDQISDQSERETSLNSANLNHSLDEHRTTVRQNETDTDVNMDHTPALIQNTHEHPTPPSLPEPAPPSTLDNEGYTDDYTV